MLLISLTAGGAGLNLAAADYGDPHGSVVEPPQPPGLGNEGVAPRSPQAEPEPRHPAGGGTKPRTAPIDRQTRPVTIYA